jgi:hypothetical protein
MTELKYVLDIPNRTENWKTAQTFIPLVNNNKLHVLASTIIKNAKGNQAELDTDNPVLELFWKGFRDYCHNKGKAKPEPAEAISLYNILFSNLRDQICEYNKAAPPKEQLQKLKPHNYVCKQNTSQIFLANLLNTEIDIVVSVPGYLLIGEAKHEETFGANSKHVLVHQLIRQYVMANILINLMDHNNKERAKTNIVPFIICDNVEQTQKSAQIKFLNSQGWLFLENVFSWDMISQLSQERKGL